MSRAIFFDFDGTLFNTRQDLAETVNHARRDLGLAELAVDAVMENVGRGARHLLTASIPEHPFETLWPVFQKRYAEHCDRTVVPYEGVRETLPALAARGWRLGINTNKPRFAVERILAKFGMADLFGAAIVAGGDLPDLKPSAATLVACAARLGTTLSPDDWMVGDSDVDLVCAANAGVKSAFCTFGFGFLRDAHYDARLDRFADLLKMA